MSTFTVVSTVTHRSLMNKSKDDLARWVLHLLDCRDENERVRVQRVVDLLEANNSYQQIARDARAALKARFDLVAHLHRQREFSLKTFGPGARTAGVVDHIRKELIEIEADPTDVKEWIDVVILAFDGAWRAGFEPSEIVEAIVAKQTRNENRRWPDWRTADPDKAIEHDRSDEQHPDDLAVDRFAAAMKAKLQWERKERGRSGWQEMSAEALSRILFEHLPKGDPVDVANLCMMLSLNGQRIVDAPEGQQEESLKAKRLTEKFAQLVRGPGAPEGRQEAVAWVRPEVLAKLLDGRAASHADLSKVRGGCFTEPLYTRPAEQVEPAAAYTIDYLGCEYVSRDVESIKRVAARGDHGPTEVVYLYEHPSAVTAVQSTHRHKKRGTRYVLLGIGKMQAERWFEPDRAEVLAGRDGRSVDMREVAVYRSADDRSLWVRPLEEFEDGRFEELPA